MAALHLQEYLAKRTGQAREDSQSPEDALSDLTTNISFFGKASTAASKSANTTLGSVDHNTSLQLKEMAIANRMSEVELITLKSLVKSQRQQLTVTDTRLSELVKEFKATGKTLADVLQSLHNQKRHSKDGQGVGMTGGVADWLAKKRAAMNQQQNGGNDGGGGGILGDLLDFGSDKRGRRVPRGRTNGKLGWFKKLAGKFGARGAAKVAAGLSLGTAAAATAMPTVLGATNTAATAAKSEGLIAKGAGMLGRATAGVTSGLANAAPNLARLGGKALGAVGGVASKLAAPLAVAFAGKDMYDAATDKTKDSEHRIMGTTAGALKGIANFGTFGLSGLLGGSDLIDYGADKTADGASWLNKKISKGMDYIPQGAQDAMFLPATALTALWDKDSRNSLATMFQDDLVQPFQELGKSWRKTVNIFGENTETFVTNTSNSFNDFIGQISSGDFSGAGSTFMNAVTPTVVTNAANSFADRRSQGGGVWEAATGALRDTVRGVTRADVDKDMVGSVNKLLIDSTQRAINSGVGYKMGGKNSAAGAIDCSGWVSEINRSMIDNINDASGKQVFDPKVKKLFQTSAGNMIDNIAKATGQSMMTNKDMSYDSLKAGMVIGVDTGKTGNDSGSTGSDHVVQVVQDPDGKKYVTESRGGKGVTKTPLQGYLDAQNKKNRKLYGVDPMLLANKGALPGQATATAKPVPGQAATPQVASATAPGQAKPKATIIPGQAAVPPTPAKVAAATTAPQVTNKPKDKVASSSAPGNKPSLNSTPVHLSDLGLLLVGTGIM